MKKSFLYVALGLMGLMGTLAMGVVNAENGITTNLDGSKTVVRSDDTRDINLTIASGNLEGGYYRGWNIPAFDGNNNQIEGVKWDDNPTSGEEHDNDRGGGGDTYENYHDNGNNRKERQGPCPTGRHVPSGKEWNDLIIARCNIEYEKCDSSNLSYSSDGHFISLRNVGEFLRQDFNFIEYQPLRSSSPIPYNNYDLSTKSIGFILDGNNAYITNGGDPVPRNIGLKVRCFKNPLEYFSLTFRDKNNHDNIIGDSIENIIGGTQITGGMLPNTLDGYRYVYYSGSDLIDDILSVIINSDTEILVEKIAIDYIITYELDGGTNSENNITGYTIETPTITLENPTKDGYTFDGWFLDTGFTNQITEITQGTTGNIILYAKWTKIETKPSGGSSSGGGGRSRSSNDSQISPDPSLSRGEEDSSLIKEGDREAVEDLDSTTPMDSSDKSSEGQTYTQEFQEAYEFAKEKGITTMPTIQKADMNGKLTRIAMAKMLSQYAMNVLGQKPANIVVPKFKDVTNKTDSDYDNGVTLAYQLGIMGQNMPNNKFRPNDEVTRAEFATALSRMIYGTSDGEYKSTPKYYIHHMEKLVKEGIITNDDPKMKELRGYVMIMLMRSSKK